MKVKELVSVLPSTARVSVMAGKRHKELLRRNVMELFEEAKQTNSFYRSKLNMEVAMLETAALKPLWFIVRVEEDDGDLEI